jgi:predicted aldo/keto reductase-like oxidoreductase
MERRDFLLGAAAAGIFVSVAKGANMQSDQDANKLPRVSNPGTLAGEMLYRELGKTGIQVSAIGMGGFHLGKPSVSEADAIKLIHSGIDRGITFMDNSWDYNNGDSEVRMGKALAQSGYRQKVTLMTKIDGRTKEEAAKQIDESLRRLQTEHLDVLQHHEVIRFDDPDRIFAEGGAMEAVVAAKQAGKVRFIGFTGHKDPHIHLYMLDVANKHGFHFDTVQMPVNALDPHFRSFSQLVVPRAIEQGIAVLGMKSMGDGVILKSGAITATECLQYALTMPTSVVITGIDKPDVLNQAFEVVKNFKPMTEQQLASLLGKTREVATAGKYELFKTSAHFDSTMHHPEWLGDETLQVKQLAPAA